MSAAAEITDDREAMHRERSRRYAEALAGAAAAEERIKALTEQLAEAEYVRRTAEDAAAVVDYLDDLDTHVYKVGDPEPDERVEYLVSLSTGLIVYRFRYRDDGPWAGWKRLDFSSNTTYEWDQVLESSPLVALTHNQSGWGIEHLIRQVNAERDQITEVRRLLPGGLPWNATLPDRLRQMLTAHKADEEKWFAQQQRIITGRTDAIFYAERMAEALTEDATPEQRAIALEAWRDARDRVSS